jgi:inner membrane protein
MLLFGHIGLTLASALLINNYLPKNTNVAQNNLSNKVDNSTEITSLKGLSAKFWGIIKDAQGIDLRFVIVGSLVPDIIDKPIGNYFLWNEFGSGYLFSHTLLFVILLVLIGYVINAIYKKNVILLLAFGSFIHLILDLIWLNQRIFLWPLFGFAFEKGTSPPFREWIWGMFLEVLREPWVAIPELIGVSITVWFVWLLWRQKKLRTFIMRGQT